MSARHKLSGCARLLALLADGRRHDHREAYGLALVAHSRAADLRACGYGIESSRDGDLHCYRLVSVPARRTRYEDELRAGGRTATADMLAAMRHGRPIAQPHPTPVAGPVDDAHDHGELSLDEARAAAREAFGQLFGESPDVAA